MRYILSTKVNVCALLPLEDLRQFDRHLVIDHLSIAFWVFAYGRLDCIKF